MPSTTFNGAGGKWVLQDSFTMPGSSRTLTLTNGTLDTNGQTCSWGLFNSSNSNTRTLTLGASAITVTATGTVTAWTTASSSGLTITANTATITITGSGSVTVQLGNKNWNGTSLVGTGAGALVMGAGGSSATIANLTRTGTADKTSQLYVSGSGLIVTSTVTLGGNSTQGVNRLLVVGGTAGSYWTITAAAYVITGDVDFMDINLAYSGGASWTNTNSAYIGDALGNAGAVTTNATVSATQTATGTASFTWSTHGWTSRVPLPQDDVVINNAFSASQTVTADMPRLGRSIDFTGCTGNPQWRWSNVSEMYGSLTLVAGMTWQAISYTFSLKGRSAGLTIASNGVTIGTAIQIGNPGSTYTIQDDLVLDLSNNLQLQFNHGTFDANNKNVTFARSAVNGSNTRTIAMGSGTWTIGGTGTVWQQGTNVTITGNPTILITDTTATAKTFAGNSYTYGTLRHTATGSAALTITGNNTFANLDLECTTARTITFPAGGSQTVTGTFTALGAAGQLLSLRSSSTGTKWYINAATTSAQYCDVKDSTASGTGTPIDNSTGGVDSGNNIGWLFSAGGSAGYSSTLLTLGVG